MQRKTKFQIRSEAAKKRWQRDEDKESFWRIHIDAWKKSGLSVRKFCHANFLTESSFRAWRRELSLRDREGTAQGTPVSAAAAEQSPFVAIRLVPDRPAHDTIASEPASGSLQIQIRGCATLSVTDQTDMALVARLVSALEAR